MKLKNKLFFRTQSDQQAFIKGLHSRQYIKIVFIIFFAISTLIAAGQNKGIKRNKNRKPDKTDSIFNKSSKTFVAIPIINNSPSMKTGFGANMMYLFKFDKKDTITPPSMISLVGFYTTNKSYVLVPAARFFWKQDKNRALLLLGSVGINNDFIYDLADESREEDIHLVYREIRSFIWLEYSHKIIGHLYLGGLYLGVKNDYKFNQGTEEENQFTEEFFQEKGITDNFVSSIGLSVLFDNRDYIYYPTKGFMLNLKPKYFATWLGGENNYTDIDFKFNGYFNLTHYMVMAVSFSGGFATGDVPFSGYQSYGMRNTLRGYPNGKYRGKYMITLQAEYRWRFYKRLGAVLFAGTGSLWGNDEQAKFYERSWLPSAGIGARFMISRVKRINLRLDYAIGVDGNQGLYFGMMEAF